MINIKGYQIIHETIPGSTNIVLNYMKNAVKSGKKFEEDIKNATIIDPNESCSLCRKFYEEYLENISKNNIKSYLEKRDKKMTNARKYLKENVDIHKLSKEIISFMNGVVEDKYIGMIEDFFNCPIKPILSENEKAVLKIINEKYKFIASDEDNDGMLYIAERSKNCNSQGRSYWFMSTFKDDLFKWIKPGEEYKIEDLLEE